MGLLSCASLQPNGMQIRGSVFRVNVNLPVALCWASLGVQCINLSWQQEHRGKGSIGRKVCEETGTGMGAVSLGGRLEYAFIEC